MRMFENLSTEQAVGTVTGSSLPVSAGDDNNDENNGWKKWSKVVCGLFVAAGSAVLGFLYWWAKQLFRIDCHWMYQEDPESDVMCTVEAESIFNRLHPSTRQQDYLPTTELSSDQITLVKQTLPRRERSFSNFWLKLPKLHLKLRYHSSFSFNTRTLIHSSFRIQAIKMTPNSNGSMAHMVQKAEVKRLFRREGGNKSFFSRANPRIVFTKTGIIDKPTGFEYAEWDPIPSEDYDTAREKIVASEASLPVTSRVKVTANGFLRETVLTMEPLHDSEGMPSTSSARMMTDG